MNRRTREYIETAREIQRRRDELENWRHKRAYIPEDVHHILQKEVWSKLTEALVLMEGHIGYEVMQEMQEDA